MKVIAAVNGLITSEVAAFYALRYAALYDYTLILLHVENPADDRDETEAGMAVIEEAAEGYGVRTERVFLQGRPASAIFAYLVRFPADTLFCSTRMRTRYFEDSLSEKLSRRNLPANLAVVRVTRVETWALTREVVLPIREERLSVEKFVFFASLAKTLEATAEIYSISPLTRLRAGRDIGSTRQLFQRINDRLNYYIHALKLMNLPFRIKHTLAANEIGQILHHLAHCDCQLLVVGGRRLSRLPRFLGESRLERLFRHTPVNTIAFYARYKR